MTQKEIVELTTENKLKSTDQGLKNQVNDLANELKDVKQLQKFEESSSAASSSVQTNVQTLALSTTTIRNFNL